MEVAGAKEMPEDAERKGLGTPATRAAILEKLVATGFVERKKSKKTVTRTGSKRSPTALKMVLKSCLKAKSTRIIFAP